MIIWFIFNHSINFKGQLLHMTILEVYNVFLTKWFVIHPDKYMNMKKWIKWRHHYIQLLDIIF